MQTAGEVILSRFKLKSRAAGGPRAGYVLRRDAILYIQEDHPDLDFSAALAQLVDDKLLQPNEAESHYFLTAAGLEKIDPTQVVEAAPASGAVASADTADG